MARAIGIGGAVICGVCFLVTRHYHYVNARAGNERMAAIGNALAWLCWCGWALGIGVALAAH